MPGNLENSSFGNLVRMYREKTVDRRVGKNLSQDRLAQKLSKKTGLMFNRNNVSNWETDKIFISAEDRYVLISLIAILVEYSGIMSLQEAEQLLEAGNFRSLNDHEKDGIGLLRNNKKIAPSFAENQLRSSDTGLGGESIQSSEKIIEFLKNTLGIKALFGDNLKAHEKTQSGHQSKVELYSAQCGNDPIDLKHQRLLVSTSFGSYFVGLLEKPNLYLDLESQIDCPTPKEQEGLAALQRVFWLLGYARGPRTLIIGGEGGMGKSTLSAKIIRCLHQDQAIDLILGDSAKGEHFDPLSKERIKLQPGYYNPDTFYNCLCGQLGLPPLPKNIAIQAIKDRLVGRRAVIVLDNLETVKQGDELLDSLKAITSREVRAIVTTRKIHGIKSLDTDRFIVQMLPISSQVTVEKFLFWHIEQHQYQHPALRKIRKDITQYSQWLIERTGGIPLLLQLVLSDVARFSWDYVQSLPSLFGQDLLNFLYQERWIDLGRQGREGEVAQTLLEWVSQEQYRGQGITSRDVSDWARNKGIDLHLPNAIALLFEMFLIINRDPQLGNFSIYPSLAEFIERQKS